MKTALINTDVWKDEKIISLNSDTRLLYMCLVTNPERNTTPAYKCGDRLLSAYTGYTKELLDICKKQLQKNKLIYFIDDYIIIGECAYVKPTKGKLTEELYSREFDKLPNKIKDFTHELLMSDSCASQEYIYIYINKDKDIDNNNREKKIKYNPLGGEILKAFEEVDPKNKTYYGNTTQRKACDYLLEEYGLDEVLKRITVLSKTNKIPYFPTINTPHDLKEKWVKLNDAVDKKRRESKNSEEKYPII